MAIKSGKVSVGTTATRLDVHTSGAASGFMTRSSILVINRSTTVSVSIGGSDVDTSTSAALRPGESMTVDVAALNAGLFGRVASGTVDVEYVQTEKFW